MDEKNILKIAETIIKRWKKRKILVSYTYEIVTKNTIVYPKGCNSITFEYMASGLLNGAYATVDGSVKIALNDSRSYDNDVCEEIQNKFNVGFNSSVPGNYLLVTRTYKQYE